MRRGRSGKKKQLSYSTWTLISQHFFFRLGSCTYYIVKISGKLTKLKIFTFNVAVANFFLGHNVWQELTVHKPVMEAVWRFLLIGGEGFFFVVPCQRKKKESLTFTVACLANFGRSFAEAGGRGGGRGKHRHSTWATSTRIWVIWGDHFVHVGRVLFCTPPPFPNVMDFLLHRTTLIHRIFFCTVHVQ